MYSFYSIKELLIYLIKIIIIFNIENEIQSQKYNILSTQALIYG